MLGLRSSESKQTTRLTLHRNSQLFQNIKIPGLSIYPIPRYGIYITKDTCNRRAGFIGAHTVVQLLKDGFHVSIIDNFDNSAMEAVDRVREIVGPNLSQNLEFTLGDLRNKDDLEKLFSKTKFDAVIHFAGLKAVGESVANPRRYFDNNLVGTINLYEVMAKHNCKNMVFSSSATVYGQPKKMPCVEDFELQATNPYGRTKLSLKKSHEIFRKLSRNGESFY
ncbi:hypothetical protein KIW84_012316 [Lathyrus oleraceus]|uniref:UDP-glucose 4-epimerase n=1 Tax=Pisum sativum TaxID=3888 RepID=A0A9D5GW48_PEA|nr:hypothetical protein KIW84_012316 [Pisum sativum]